MTMSRRSILSAESGLGFHFLVLFLRLEKARELHTVPPKNLPFIHFLSLCVSEIFFCFELSLLTLDLISRTGFGINASGRLKSANYLNFNSSLKSHTLAYSSQCHYLLKGRVPAAPELPVSTGDSNQEELLFRLHPTPYLFFLSPPIFQNNYPTV